MSTDNAATVDTSKEQEEVTKKEDTTESSASNNKRPLSPPSAKGEGKRGSKKTKKEAAASQRRGYDYHIDQRDRAPHEGSFATPAMREQFGVTLDDRVTLDENQATVKRKVALLLGFLGTKYVGFQVNMNQRTLQAEVELALYKAGMLSKMNFGHPYKYGWSTSARTDKGVHACAQVCSLKVELPESDFENLEGARQRLEEQLPADIRVLDILRTTRPFCAKTQRERVRYQYMIPSFMLHPDYRGLLTEQGISLEGRKDVAKAPLSKEEIQKLQAVLAGYRTTEEQRTLLQSALKKYEGTHPFHNFTKGVKVGQATANRYMESFHVQDPVIIDGLEWIPTQVLGQSFLLHQIRKMVSMAVDVARGAAPLETLDRALSKKEIIRVAPAPAQGLFLELSYYTGYNNRKSSNKELSDLDWTVEGPAKDRWAAFRSTIRQHVAEEEVGQGNFLQYLYVQECIFDYKKFYRLDGNTDENAEWDNYYQADADDKKSD